MITIEEIVQRDQNRHKRLQKWLDEKPETKSVSRLRKDLKNWETEISEAELLDKKYNSQFSNTDIRPMYLFLNLATAIFDHRTVALHYIKKLEKELKLKTRK